MQKKSVWGVCILFVNPGCDTDDGDEDDGNEHVKPENGDQADQDP